MSDPTIEISVTKLAAHWLLQFPDIPSDGIVTDDKAQKLDVSDITAAKLLDGITAIVGSDDSDGPKGLINHPDWPPKAAAQCRKVLGGLATKVQAALDAYDTARAEPEPADEPEPEPERPGGTMAPAVMHVVCTPRLLETLFHRRPAEVAVAVEHGRIAQRATLRLGNETIKLLDFDSAIRHFMGSDDMRNPSTLQLAARLEAMRGHLTDIVCGGVMLRVQHTSHWVTVHP